MCGGGGGGGRREIFGGKCQESVSTADCGNPVLFGTSFQSSFVTSFARIMYHFFNGSQKKFQKNSKKEIPKRTRFPQLAVIYFEALDLKLSLFFFEAAKRKSNVRVWFSFGVCPYLPGHAVPRLKASGIHKRTLAHTRQ